MTKLQIQTSVIHESPLHYEALDWDSIVMRAGEIEQRFGWRYLWEGDFARHLLVAAKRAMTYYVKAQEWHPVDQLERDNKASLQSDLGAYLHFFLRAVALIDAWATSPSGTRQPTLASVVAEVA